MLTTSTRVWWAIALCSTLTPLPHQPGRRRRQGVGDLQRPVVAARPPLDQRQRLVAAVDPGAVAKRAVLDVHVQPRHAVRGDHRLVGRDQVLEVGAGVGQLPAGVVGAVPAERGDHVPAHLLAQGLDLPRTGRRHGLCGIAVPGRGARALRRCFEEGQRQVPGTRLRARCRARSSGRPGLEVGRVDVCRNRRGPVPLPATAPLATDVPARHSIAAAGNTVRRTTRRRREPPAHRGHPTCEAPAFNPAGVARHAH